jgi:hypothetical protein
MVSLIALAPRSSDHTGIISITTSFFPRNTGTTLPGGKIAASSQPYFHQQVKIQTSRPPQTLGKRSHAWTAKSGAY